MGSYENNNAECIVSCLISSVHTATAEVPQTLGPMALGWFPLLSH